MKLKTRVTKKVLNEVAAIIYTHGYWSDEYREYIAAFDYDARMRLHDKFRS